MNIYFIYLSICLLSASVALVATPIVRRVALRCNQLDAPSARKVHQQPTVRLGGVAIFGATVFSLVCAWCSGLLGDVSSENLSTVILLLFGGGGFFLIGFTDDLRELSPFHRLWMQVAVATVLWCLGIRIDSWVLPGWEESAFLSWLSLPVTILWLVGVVNAMNWMDGLDGLTTGVASIATIVLVALGIIFSQPVAVLFGVALLGSLLGFLYHNYNPAKIFMGDGGSYFIGFALASLCIVGPQRADSPFSMLLPLVILAVPLGDMVGVIVVRLYRGRSPFFADNCHLHHRLLQSGFSHQATVLIIYVLTSAISSLALVLAGVIQGIFLWVSLFVVFAFLLWQVRQVAMLHTPASDIVRRKEIWYSENL